MGTACICIRKGRKILFGKRGKMRILFCELKKAICQKGFPAAALAIGALCFSANAYFDETMKPYTVLEAMVSLDREVIRADTSLSAYMLFKGALTSGYTALFLPLVAAFPFMFSFCAERDSGMIRFTVARTERRKYYLAKFLAAMISAGGAAVCGAAVYGLVLKLAFPSILSYQVDAETLDWIMPYGYAGTLTLLFVRFFVLGALYALPAFVISSFCKDVYVILCVPFPIFQTSPRRSAQKNGGRGQPHIMCPIEIYIRAAENTTEKISRRSGMRRARCRSLRIWQGCLLPEPSPGRSAASRTVRDGRLS